MEPRVEVHSEAIAEGPGSSSRRKLYLEPLALPARFSDRGIFVPLRRVRCRRGRRDVTVEAEEVGRVVAVLERDQALRGREPAGLLAVPIPRKREHWYTIAF